MKKYLLSMAVLMTGAAVLTSCDDDETPYVPQPVDVSYGVYVVNSGNQRNSINGSLTYVNADTWNSTKDAFFSANSRYLGLTPNDGVVYGSKLYVVVSGENTIEVLDNSSLRSLAQLKTTDVMGEDKGKTPRHLLAYGGCVFVSTYDGYVAAIDTATYSAAAIYQAGSYPEGMAVYGGYLYVANSDYGRGEKPSLSMINLTTGETKEYTNELLNNPVALAANEYGLFVLDYGKYDEYWNQSEAGVRKLKDGEMSIVVDATAMAVAGSKIYAINAPYNSDPRVKPSYTVYDMATGATSEFLSDGEWTSDDEYVKNPNAPFSATAIGTDPLRGYVYIASYAKDPETGYPAYTLDGSLNVYDVNGNLLKTCVTGVGPTAIVLNTGIAYE